MSHVVLLGDSIFDNARYVPGGPPVIDQLRAALPVGWAATLVATDGHTVANIVSQLARVPANTTHLVLSVGGNDALLASDLLLGPASTVGGALATIAGALDRFRSAYNAMLRDVLALKKSTAVCTIYDAIPTLSGAERAALAGFNDVISRAAATAGVPLIDLRVVCADARDYSELSAIEPSVAGGAKMVAAIGRMLTGHDFAARRCAVWV
jgi:hypothetical protein